jgi:hypothetical protein
MALRHQNLIGWHNFLCGYISKKWSNGQSFSINSAQQVNSQTWAKKLIKIALELLSNIWEDRNNTIHGTTMEESKQKAREAILSKVKDMYHKPPRLAPRYPTITVIPLEQCIKCSTQHLKDWLIRIEHQIKVSDLIFANRPPGQMMIPQAFKNAVKVRGGTGKDKYPP